MNQIYLVNTYELRHVNHQDRHFGSKFKNQIITLSLANFQKKRVKEMCTQIEKWSYVFQDTDMTTANIEDISPVKILQNVEELVAEEPGLKCFIDRLNFDNFSEDARYSYLRNQRAFRENIAFVRLRTIMTPIIKTMHAAKMSVEDIAKVCNMEEDDVENIIQELPEEEN